MRKLSGDEILDMYHNVYHVFIQSEESNQMPMRDNETHHAFYTQQRFQEQEQEMFEDLPETDEHDETDDPLWIQMLGVRTVNGKQYSNNFKERDDWDQPCMRWTQAQIKSMPNWITKTKQNYEHETEYTNHDPANTTKEQKFAYYIIVQHFNDLQNGIARDP